MIYFLSRIIFTATLVITSLIALSQGSMGLEFDGVDDYAVIVNQSAEPTLETNFSFGATIKVSEVNSFSTILGKKDYQGQGIVQFGVNINGYLFLKCNGILYTGNGIYDLLDEQCHHVAVSVNEEEVNFFVDGNRVSAKTAMVNHIVSNIDSLFLGNLLGEEEEAAFSGLIDDIRIWRTNRSAGDYQGNLTNIQFQTSNLQELYFAADFGSPEFYGEKLA